MNFVRVASVDDVEDGSARRVEVGGHPVALVRTGGRFYAVDDTCTHEDESLSAGYVEDGKIECPRHGATFDLNTGAALCLPATQGLNTWAVLVDGNDILVGREE